MVRELYIDNQRVDLPDDVRFQLTFEIADFGELKPRGSGSSTIRLPKTPRNTDIFENCNFVQVASDYPYALHSAYYYEDGWLVFNDATVYMLSITDKDFEIQCTWGNAPEIARLKSLDMGNVGGLGNVNYGAAVYAGVETGITENKGETERYNLSVRGTSLYSPYTRGALSVKTAFEKIGIDTGDGMSDAIKSYIDQLYVFPTSKSAVKRYSDVTFSYPRKRTTLKPNEISDKGTENGQLRRWNYGDGDGSNRRATFFFEPDQNEYTAVTESSIEGRAPQMIPGKWYDVDIEVIVYAVEIGRQDGQSFDYDRANFSINAVLGQVMGQQDNAAWSGDKLASVPTNDDSTLVLTGALPAAWNVPTVLRGTKRILYNGNEVKLSDAGNSGVPPLYLAIYPTTSYAGYQDMVLWGQVEAQALLTVSAVGGEIETEINMPEETTAGLQDNPTVGFADVLRGVKAYDFVTQALINAGAIFDRKDGTTRVFTYDDIANTDPVDWSDKLVYIKDEDTLNTSVGARNWIRYKESDEYNGYGDGYYTDPLSSALRKADKNVIQNSLFGSVNDNGRKVAFQVFRAASIPMFRKKDGEVEHIESGMHLVRLSTSGSGYTLKNRSGQVVPTSVRIMQSDENQPTFDSIRATNWNRYIAMQQRYRKAKAIFMLSGQDIAELDFGRPVYLRQYAQSYVVTKVNYQPKASTVEMMLIR